MRLQWNILFSDKWIRNLNRFEINAPFEPAGDQPQAIRELVDGLSDGLSAQTLLGVTGSGKNVYHCQCNPGDSASCLDYGAQ